MKTLIIGLNWLGDVIMSFPALSLASTIASPDALEFRNGQPHATHSPNSSQTNQMDSMGSDVIDIPRPPCVNPGLDVSYPDETQTVDILTRPNLGSLYFLHPGVQRIHVLPSAHFSTALLPQLKKLRALKYRKIIIFPRSLRTALLAFLIGAPERIGYAGEGRSFLLTRAIPLPHHLKSFHETRLHAHLVQAAFNPSSSQAADSSQEKSFFSRKDPLEVNLRVPTQEAVETVRSRYGILGGRQYAVFAPGAAFGPAKRWPAERFAELARRLAEETGLCVIATGSSAEADLTATTVAECRRILPHSAIDLGGKTPLPDLISLLSGASLLVSNDSGTMHLGAALGIPTIVIVGSTDMARTGPLGHRHRIVQGDSCVPPCRQKTCSRGDYRCLTTISAEAVFSHAKNLLFTGTTCKI